ncbi:MAG: DNA-directed RNA polymerase III 31 kDa polypeptide [Nitrosopumilales archaeon]|jgi:hypothetical protein|nr:MAG: DNA-directed RNA polymerase III 31 kDa polypeptide [Nitrosopumilales archaeon]
MLQKNSSEFEDNEFEDEFEDDLEDTEKDD